MNLPRPPIYFDGWFLLFWISRGDIVVSSWPALGVLFFLVGQCCSGMVLLGVRMVAHNARQSRRSFVVGTVYASIGVGMLIWTFLDYWVFTSNGSMWYILTEAVVVPLFFFLSAFSLHQVEKPQGLVSAEPHEPAPTIPPLFDSALPGIKLPETDGDGAFRNNDGKINYTEASALIDDDDLGFRTDDPNPEDSILDRRGSRREASVFWSHLLLGTSLGLIVPATSLIIWIENDLVSMIGISSTTSYLYPGALVCAALLTGFFADFFSATSRPFWLFLAGAVSCASHLIAALEPSDFWLGEQILQGGSLATALVAGVSHLSLVFGVARLGVTTGLAGVPMGVVFIILSVIYYIPCSKTRSTCIFYTLAGTSGVGGLCGGISGILWKQAAAHGHRVVMDHE